jgi:hypothetical protein
VFHEVVSPSRRLQESQSDEGRTGHAAGLRERTQTAK